jgi:hypothetical protein
VPPGSLLLSGACGEWLAGDDPEVRVIDTLATPEDVLLVYRYGGMHADSAMSRFKSERLGAQRLLESEPRMRTEMLPRVLTVIRLRMTLLCYLLRVPASFGLDARAPFLDIDLGMRMLTLPPAIRHKRCWERDFFRLHGVDLEAVRGDWDTRNTLNFRALRAVPLQPLDEALLGEVVRPEYVRWVNRNVGTLGRLWEVYWRLSFQPGCRRAVEALKRRGLTDRRLPAYCAYLTLKPLESLLRRRDLARRGQVCR